MISRITDDTPAPSAPSAQAAATPVSPSVTTGSAMPAMTPEAATVRIPEDATTIIPKVPQAPDPSATTVRLDADVTAMIPVVPSAGDAPGARTTKPSPRSGKAAKSSSQAAKTPLAAASPADATTIIPVIPADDATTMIPAITDAHGEVITIRLDGAEDASSTMMIGKVLPAPADAADSAPRAVRPGDPPVRAVRTKRGDYLSAYSDYTRVTVGSVIRTTFRTIGELMITCGIVILLFAGYEIWGKTAIVDAHQSDLDQLLVQEWDKPLPTPTGTGKALPPPPGNVIGRLYIPRLDKHWVITQGVTPNDIRYAPGHYPKSAMPGQAGNFAMAGHRMRSVWWDLDLLQVGDKIIVETRTTWYIYAVDKSRIVKPSAIEVVSSRPPTMDAYDHLITLTTCNPKWNNYQRLIIHGHLVGSQSRADGPPEGLNG